MPAKTEKDPYVGKILLGKYRCLERIGDGTTCRVYKVQHAKLAGFRAMKVLRPELIGKPEIVEAFWREARVASSLRQGNVVILHDVDALPDATPCSVWEYIEGESLSDRVRRAPLGAETAALARGLCNALQELHDHGLAHLDLYPDNILLTHAHGGGLEARLVDFGEARPIGSAPLRVAEPIRIGYSAPEQLGAGQHVDARADVFALGAVLCFALTGRPPVQSPDLETYGQTWRHLVPAKLEIMSELPPALAAVIEHCLAPVPTDRPEDAAAVREAIRRGARGDRSAASGPTAEVETALGHRMPVTAPATRPVPASNPVRAEAQPRARLEAVAADEFPSAEIGHTATIGRLPTNSVQIDHPTVSKNHAKIRFDNGGYYLEDLGSRNGTSVNGRRVQAATPIHEGDTIALGDVILRFHSS